MLRAGLINLHDLSLKRLLFARTRPLAARLALNIPSLNISENTLSLIPAYPSPAKLIRALPIETPMQGQR